MAILDGLKIISTIINIVLYSISKFDNFYEILV